MPLVPLQIPPGVYRNGTDMQAAGRWRDASLVRWTDGTMRPVAGWEARFDINDAVPRGMHAWRDLSNNRYIAAGMWDKLYAISQAGTVTDITPAGLTTGNVAATQNLGYGGGLYGVGAYGTPRTDTGSFTEATTWSLDNWGEELVACSNADGDLYAWDLNVANNGVTIPNAPTSNLGLIVTEERFLFALGAGGNPRKVQWSDREDREMWTAAATNEAGDLELQTSGQIMQGVRTRGQTLILTDIDAHTATYQGPPFVYGFERVGSACGTISRKAAAVVDAGVFWMGLGSFFVYAGGAVQEVPCEVVDYVFTDFNNSYRSHVWAVSNAQHSEVWWFYPSSSATECDRYVSYNYLERHWSIGTLSRTAGVDRGVFATPIWLDATGQAYNQETGTAYGGDSIFAESGPISIGVGDNVAVCTMLIPDEKTQGQVTATFKTRFHPNDTERSYGPYSMANPTDVRFTGRQIRMRINGTAADWRVGIPRLDMKPGGLR
jgi:hypothetical protein